MMAPVLHEFVTTNRVEIITRCRSIVAARSSPPPSPAEIDHGVPLFLDQLVTALRHGTVSHPDIDRSAGEHGHDLLKQGFTLAQVVHDYGDVCQTITALAAETRAPISVEDFRTLNRCLDEAIAGAVTIYARESQAMASQRQADATGMSAERFGFLVHELRNLINTAILSFEVVKSGNVGVTGATGQILKRSLDGLRDLVSHSVDQVRMTSGHLNPSRLVVADFIREVAARARLDATARGIGLTVVAADESLEIDADRQVLGAVVANLVQNGVKFTAPGTQVILRVRGSADRVLIEVEDECGGLPGGEDGAEMSATFEQRRADRSGLGIGLSFSRWGAGASGGRLYARNRDKGCVFTVDLPRAGTAAVPA